MHLEPYQQRVIEEASELAGRLRSLRLFAHTAEFAGLPEVSRDLLGKQATAMQVLLDILRERVMLFHMKPEGCE